MLIAKCEHCGSVEQVPDSYAGQTLECECGHEVIVPSLPESNGKIQPINMPATKKPDKDKLKLPKDNMLHWVAFLCDAVAILFGLVSVLYLVAAFNATASSIVPLTSLIGFGALLASAIFWAAIGEIARVVGMIELNGRASNEILNAVLKEVESTSLQELWQDRSCQ